MAKKENLLSAYNRVTIIVATSLLLSGLAAPATSKGAVTLTTLVSFDGTNGTSPTTGFVLGADGDLYSMAPGGVYGGNGTAFRMSTNGLFTNIASISASNGFYNGKLVQGTDGYFYGTDPIGGTNDNGAIIRLAPDGTLILLASFSSDCGFPQTELLEGSDGNFYGTASFGGHGNNGAIFRMTPNGALTNLVYFEGTNGANPWFGPLVQGNDGNFYGITSAGGPYGYGGIFRMTPDGSLTNLVFFDGTNGGSSIYGLTLGADGNFYGTTWGTGALDDFGNVFRLTPQGTLSALALFNGTNGLSPRKIIQGTDGNFYGVTALGGVGFNGNHGSGNGTIFKMTPDGTLTTLFAFDGTNGFDPFGGLVQAGDGDFYGTTFKGGINDFGTIFRLHVPGAEAPKILSLARSNTLTTLAWIGLFGRTYQLQYKTDLGQINWNDSVSTIKSTNTLTIASDPGDLDLQRFYRLVLQP